MEADAKRRGGALRARTLRLLQRVGVPYYDTLDRQWYDGQRIAAGARVSVDGILHEAAHWLVSTPENRLQINFGLGVGPEPAPSGVYAPSPVLVEDNIQEEVIASGGGIILMAMVGGAYAATLRDHCWGEAGTSESECDEMRLAAGRLAAAGVQIPNAALDKVLRALRRLVRESIRRAQRTP